MWTDRRSGQTNQRGSQDHRDPYERDSTRVIHCPAFRRLQRKTQILGPGEGDFHRTRLTHSLEAASIGRGIVRNLAMSDAAAVFSDLLPNDDLISVICLLHDIGHPPFGHGGETALNYMMRAHGGFEGNAQTLRLVTKVENSYGAYGLDLTRRTLLGILKYPLPYSKVVAKAWPEAQASFSHARCMNDWLPPKAYFDSESAEVEWLLAPLSASDQARFQTLLEPPQEGRHGQAAYQTFDCSIMNIADDIAYGVHDLEDAIHLRLIERTAFDTSDLRQLLIETPLGAQTGLLDHLFDKALDVRKQAIGEMVHYFITATQVSVAHESFETPILKYNMQLLPEAKALLEYLVRFIYRQVIDSQEARLFEYGGQTVITRLFEAISSNPVSLLDEKNRALFLESEDVSERLRVICDYIANMTDEYAYRVHDRLFGFRAGVSMMGIRL